MSRRLRPRHRPPERVDPPPVAGRVPPNDLDAEAAVLSASMLSREALDIAIENLKPEHFYSEANGRVWQAITQLAGNNIPVDLVSVSGWLRDREWLQKMGGAAYLAGLADATPALSHIATHARIVQEKWRLRQLIATCQRVSAEGYGDVGDVGEFVKEASEAVDDIAQYGGHQQGQLRPVSEVLHKAFAQVTAVAESGKRIAGTPTGFDRLDAKTAGLHDGDLTIVAARPGLGKTSFVMNVAVNVATPPEPGAVWQGVCVFSLEMPEEQLGTRMACSEGRVDLGRVRQGHLHGEDWKRLTEASAYISQLPIWIDDSPAIDLLTLRAKVRRQQAAWNREAEQGQPARRVGLVVVDYLQLMKGREGADNREQEVAELSRGLKALAKELKVPIIALSQLNRAVETRGKDKRPQLSDLRESGAIEQDADTVILMYRDDYYHEDSDRKGLAELNIAKQRNGPTGRVLVRFAASCTRIDNLEPGDYPEADE